MDTILTTLRRVISYLYPQQHTWRDIQRFDHAWTIRIREMSKYITPGASILDLGCGKMWLKQYMKGGSYYGVDYTDRGEGTLICDFNKKEFPKVKSDVAFVSGVFEYVRNPPWFVSSISKNCNECILSYCLIEDYPDITWRRKQAWVNDYSKNEIIELFSNAGFRLEAENDNIPKNRIFYFTK